VSTFLDNNTWGVYAPPAPFPDVQAHYDFEKLVGRKIPLMSWFSNWSIGLPRAAEAQAAQSGHQIMIAWMPQLNGGAPVPFRDILDGWWDGYITDFFGACGEHPRNVTVRFAHESNLGLNPWCANVKSACTDVEQWKDVWRHIWSLLDALKLHPRVQLQWCMATSDKGGIPMEDYWPGSKYVGKFGIDIYNGHGAKRWWEARQLIKPWYDRFLALGDQPIWIAELGCREPSKDEKSNVADLTQSKAAWMQNLFASEEFPRITHTAFFQAERMNDWRVNSSPEALSVVRSAMARRYPSDPVQ
jgi:mannan endo-1,4-beta-mannosidase